MRYYFVLASKNKKTGPIPITMSGAQTCPDSCALKAKGCYAQTGQLSIHWRRVSNNKIGLSWAEFLNRITSLPRRQFFRHNQAGDLPGDNEKINPVMLNQLVKAAKNKLGFTYTHKPVLGNSNIALNNRKVIKSANNRGFTINLSADSIEDADQKKKLNIGPVVVVLPSDSQNTIFTPAGNKVVVCPAQNKEGLNCNSCRLCQKAERGVIIGFKAHGVRKGFVDAILKK